MRAKKLPSTFTKIDGFKVKSNCRICGKKSFGKKQSYYCKECAIKRKEYLDRKALEEEKENK